MPGTQLEGHMQPHSRSAYWLIDLSRGSDLFRSYISSILGATKLDVVYRSQAKKIGWLFCK